MLDRPSRVSLRRSSALLYLVAGCFLLGLFLPAAIRASERRRTPVVRAVERARPAVVSVNGEKIVGSVADDHSPYEADHPVVGPMIMPGAPVNFSHDRYEAGDRTPAFGEHLREVLGELDYSDDEIDRLIADQAVSEELP